MSRGSVKTKAGQQFGIKLGRIDGQLVLRLICIPFLQHPFAKFLGVPLVGILHDTKLISLNGVAGVIELLCGTFAFIGFKTRAVSFLLSGEMAFAYFLVHAPRGFFPILNGGEPACLYCFVFLALAFLGGGRFSIDEMHNSEASV